MNDVPAHEKQTIEELTDPGDFCWTSTSAGETCGMIHRCPCGHETSGLSFRNSPAAQPGRTWSWDGNREKPTLQPSVRNTECGWHGYLRGGVWIGKMEPVRP